MTAPSITNATQTESSITEVGSVTFSCDVANTPTDVWVKIGNARTVLTNTTGTTYSASERGYIIKADTYTTAEITFYAVNADGYDTANSDTALAVTAMDYSTMYETLWEAIYDRVNAQVTDPLDRSKWIYARFPQDDIDGAKKKGINYPIIIISKIRARTERKTYHAKRAMISFDIDIMDTGGERLEQLSSDVFYAINSYRDTLRCTYHLSDLELSNTFEDDFMRGAESLHLKSLTFEGRYGFGD